MIRSRNQNSVLAVATLGVYLGLILVGATPSVLAQAAFAKRDNRFVCKNNGLINDERQEDIDPFAYGLAGAILQLVDSTKVRAELVRPKNEDFYLTWTDFASYRNARGEIIDDEWTDSSSSWASAAHAGIVAEIQSNFLTPLADCTTPVAKKTVLASSDFRLDRERLSLQLVVRKASHERAAELVTVLNNVFKIHADSDEDLKSRQLYASTTAQSVNDKVFIVTRLPRGSLDTLLASNAK